MSSFAVIVVFFVVVAVRPRIRLGIWDVFHLVLTSVVTPRSFCLKNNLLTNSLCDPSYLTLGKNPFKNVQTTFGTFFCVPLCYFLHFDNADTNTSFSNEEEESMNENEINNAIVEKEAVTRDVSIESQLLSSGLGRKKAKEDGDDVVPTIDCRLDEQQFRKEIQTAAKTVGFFTLLNNPHVSDEDIDAQFRLSRAFFARDTVTKEKYSPYDASLNSGYEYKKQVRPSTKLADEKESYQVTAKEKNMWNRWPKDMEKKFEFEKNTRVFMAKSLRLAQMVIRCLQDGETEDDVAEKHSLWTEESQCTLRHIHYPPFRSMEDAEEQSRLGYMRAGAHTDWCCVTLLYQQVEFGNGGLECASNPRKNGFENTEWTRIDHTNKGAVTVNIGDMLSLWTNGSLLSNLHRVRMPTGEEALKSRHSMAFFAQADESAVIRAKGQETLTAKEYILGRIRSNFNN